MTIYVVRPGDSVWAISRRFGVSMQSIVAANELDQLPGLVVGQALVIPTTEQVYTVRPGDNLYTIARRFGVSVQSIIALNGISNPNMIMPGMVIRIPQQAKNYGFVETNAYIEPSTTENETRLVDETGPLLTYISPFSYRANADGTLIPIDDTAILNAAKKYKTAGLMVITNFKEGTFDTALGTAILGSVDVQRRLIANVVETAKDKGYYGVNVDFERIAPDDRERYNQFLQRLADALHAENKVLSTALAPKLSDAQEGAWYSAHDYAAHGRIADFVILMTYEWGWSGGPPMAVSPINQVRAVINYAVSVIPSKKVMMSLPLYGYDWVLPYMPRGTTYAKRISPQEAIALAYNRGAVIQYDQQSQAPFFYYYDTSGVQHVVWFEDARSVQAKLLLINQFDLRGVSYWVLGPRFPQNWEILDNMFSIVKVIS